MARLLDDCGLADCRLSYHGETVSRLRRRLGLVHRVQDRARRWSNALVGRVPDSAEHDPKAWAAHLETDEPARWLRALARKG